MSVNYREPQWLLPNEKNLQYPAAGATQGSGLTADRHSLYSMDFDGSNDYINAGDLSILSEATAVSVSLWFNRDTTTNQFLLDLKDGSSRIGLQLYTSNSIYFYVNNKSYFHSTSPSINQWYNLVYVFNGAGATNADKLKMYLNGTELTGGTYSGTIDSAIGALTSSMTSDIGRTASTAYFSGQIDEVAIFSRALSSSEITTLYNSGSPYNPMLLSGKPVAYYPLGEQARNPNGSSDWRFPNEVLQSQTIDFDGTDYISTGLNLGYSNVPTWTISYWIKCDAASFTNFDSYFAIGVDVTGGTYNYSAGRLYKDGAGLKVYAQGSSSSSGSTNLSDGQWHNIVQTYVDQGSNVQTTNIYVDGNSTPEVTVNTLNYQILANDLFIGFRKAGSAGSFDNPFIGEISNVVVWDTDQSSNIANIYNYGAPQTSYTVTPTAWYKLDKTSEYAGLNPNWHNALSFSGTNQYIDCGNDTSLQITSDLTVSAWIKTTTSGNKIVLGKADSPITADRSWLMYINSGTTDLRVFMYDTSATLFYVISPSAINDGNWHHVAFTYTPSTSLILYIDGEAVDTNTSSIPASLQNSAENFFIGKWGNSSSEMFPGEISNVAIYNQTISAEDVKYLYNGGTPQTNISFEPVSWWKLNNLAAGIQDSGSASNNGTATGPPTEVTDSVAVDQWNFDNTVQSQTPNWSSALSFDGSSNYVDCGNDSSLQITDNLTVSAWFKLLNNSTNEVIVARDNGSGDRNWSLRVANTGQVYGLIRKSDDSGWGGDVLSPSAYDDGKWHHAAIIYTPSTSLVLYVDGVEVATDTTDIASAINNDAAGLTIGGYFQPGFTGEKFDGEISNVAIYNTALDAAVISTLYNNGQPETAISSSPVSWWKLNDTTIQDSVGSNNGTNNGATEIQTNVWTPRLNGESSTLPSSALISSDLQFNSAYSSFSLDFDGASTRVLASDPIGVGIGKSGQSSSVSFWFNLENINAALYFFMFSQGTDSSQGAGTGLRIYWTTNDDQIRAELPGGGNVQTGTNSVVDNNTWFHYVLTVDHSNTTAKVYLNGQYKAEASYTETATDVDKFQFIGSDQYNPNSYEMLGMLDECAVFNKVLNQAEITSMYNNGYPADLTSLSPVSWWRLGEDAYYDGTDFTIPNKITGAPNGVSIGMGASALVANAPGSYAAGLGSSLVEVDRIGDAPLSTANSLSFNMIPSNRVSYPSGYVPTQADNVYSMAFDGASDYIYTPSPSLGITNTWSVSAWVKTADKTSDGGSFRGWFATGGWNTTGDFKLSVRSDNGYASVWEGSLGQVIVGTSNITDDNWYNVVLTKTASDLTLFVNGVQQATVSNSSTWAFNNIYIGAGGQSTGITTAGMWNGNIDELAVFDYALSARQIKQDIYNGTTSGKTADLNNISNLTAPVAWYRMGD